MSVTICWRPVEKNRHRFEHGASTSWARLQEVFGNDPTLGPSHVPMLIAMSKAADNEFYREIAERIEAVGEIALWGEW